MYLVNIYSLFLQQCEYCHLKTGGSAIDSGCKLTKLQTKRTHWTPLTPHMSDGLT